MTRSLLSVGLLLALASAAAVAAPPPDAAAEIDRLLTAWHHAAAVADAKTYFGMLAPDAVFLGTDPGERWTKPEFVAMASPYFKRPSAWVYVATRRWVTVAPGGDVAWFDELLDSKSYWTCRGSGVLTREHGAWLIRQYNLAFTIPNGTEKEIKAIVLGHRTPSPTP